MLYVRVSCFVERRCAVWRMYINVCNCDTFSVVNVYLDYFKLCVVCLMVEGMSVVVNMMLSIMSPSPALCNLSARMVMKPCTLGVLALEVSLVSEL